MSARAWNAVTLGEKSVHGKVDVAQSFSLAIVAEANVSEFDFPLDSCELRCIFAIHDFTLLSQESHQVVGVCQVLGDSSAARGSASSTDNT